MLLPHGIPVNPMGQCTSRRPPAADYACSGSTVAGWLPG